MWFSPSSAALSMMWYWQGTPRESVRLMVILEGLAPSPPGLAAWYSALASAGGTYVPSCKKAAAL